MKHSTENAFDTSTPLPHSVEAEQSLIRCLLLDNQALHNIADILSVQDFYGNNHQAIFQHVAKLIEQHSPANIETLTSSLENTAELNEVGGIAYLTELTQSVATTGNICHYAKIIHENAVKRKLIIDLTKITEKAYACHDCNIQQLIDEAQVKLFELADDVKRNSECFVDFRMLLPQLADNIDQLYTCEQKSDITGIATGFEDLDSITSGLQGGDLIVVAGRPLTGKTALSSNIAEHVALDTGLPVAIFSMEIATTQLAMRMLISAGRLNQHRMRTGRLEDEDWQGLTSALGTFNDTPIFIDGSTGLSCFDLRARAHRLHRQCGKLGLIIIDSLQSISATEGREGRNNSVATAEILRSLKTLAKDLDVAVIVTSQLKRSVEKRSDKHPTLSDLGKSGVIEQNADVILFVYRDELYNPDSIYKDSAEITVAKHPSGLMGRVRLAFTAQHIRFENYIHTCRY